MKDKEGKFNLTFWEDYSQFFNPSSYNWITFNLIHFNIEWDKYDNSFNVEIGLFGLNVLWQVALPWETKQSRKLKKILKESKHGKWVKWN